MQRRSRLAENPNDKLLPSVAQMADAVQRLAFTADVRTGGYPFWLRVGGTGQALASEISAAASGGPSPRGQPGY